MSERKLRVVFMGTPDFSVPTLKMLIQNYDVLAVVTQTDKPNGRGHNIKFSPVKEVALENDLLIYQPKKIRGNDEFLMSMRGLDPDVIVVVAYGKILPKEIINLPRYGCINSHASLLPRHRGASPINFAIISGDTESGITTMFMDEGLDTGDIIEKYETTIGDTMTAGELHDELKELSAYAIRDTLLKIEKEEFTRKKQNDLVSTYAPLLSKEVGRIDFSKSAKEIVNLIRGLNPWPIAYCLYKEKKMKIYEAVDCRIDDKYDGYKFGDILNIDDEGILVKCGDGGIIIRVIQFENKKAMYVKSFLNGNTIEKLNLS